MLGIKALGSKQALLAKFSKALCIFCLGCWLVAREKTNHKTTKQLENIAQKTRGLWAPEVPMEAKNAMSSGGTAPAFSKSCLDLCAKSCTSCGLIVPQAHLSSKDVPSSDEASLVVAGSSPASLCLMPPFLLFFAKGSPDIPMAEAKGTKLCTVRKEQRLNSFTMDMLVGMLCWEADSGNLHSHSNHNQTCHMNTKNS